MLLEWREEFRTGIAEVDHEHRELIAWINAAFAALDGNAGNSLIEPTLGEIFAMISAHFALEESVMARCAYPALPDHKADHERLLDDIRDIMDGVAAHGVVDAPLFASRLDDWFGVHFRTHDARLHRHLAGAKHAERP
jgi:hemerythrin-like metal-binding protein